MGLLNKIVIDSPYSPAERIQNGKNRNLKICHLVL